MNSHSESFLIPLSNEALKNLHLKQKISDDSGASDLPNMDFKVQIIGPSEAFLHAVVDCLCSFEWPFSNIAISGIGTLQHQNVKGLIPVINQAAKSGVIPIVIGFDNQILKSVFDGFQFLENLFSICSVQDSLGRDSDIVRELIELKDPFFYRLSVLGTQAHLISKDLVSARDMIDQVRLGKLKTDVTAAEPKIRNSDIFSFDLNALKYSAADSQSRHSSIGFNTEEGSQLMYYAGRSERNKSICIYGIDTVQKLSQLSVNTISTLIWYYLHGLDMRKGSYPPNTNRMTSFIVEAQDHLTSFQFYKDEGEQKWWLKADNRADNQLAKAYPLIACDYSDYSSLIEGQNPTEHVLSMLDLYHSFDS